MLVVLVKLDLLVQFICNVIYSYTRVAGLPEAVEKLAVLTLLIPYDRCINNGSGAFGIYLELIDDLVNAHGLDLLAAVRAERLSYTRIKKSEVIVYLGNSTYCGSGIADRGLLVNGDRRRQSFNTVQVRLIELA